LVEEEGGDSVKGPRIHRDEITRDLLLTIDGWQDDQYLEVEWFNDRYVAGKFSDGRSLSFDDRNLTWYLYKVAATLPPPLPSKRYVVEHRPPKKGERYLVPTSVVDGIGVAPFDFENFAHAVVVAELDSDTKVVQIRKPERGEQYVEANVIGDVHLQTAGFGRFSKRAVVVA
jgi:hypothetical protein